MKSKLTKSIFSGVSSVIFFFIFVRFFATYSYSILGLTRSEFLFTHLIPLFAFFFGVSVLFFINFYQLISGKLVRKFILVEWLSYFVLLFIMVMFKSIGIKGLNLNPLDLFSSDLNGISVTIMNILAFVPIGSFFYAWTKMSLKKTLIICGIFISLMEISQYLFSLGICDIDDLITNLFGIYIGYIIFQALSYFGISARKETKYIQLSLDKTKQSLKK